MTSGGSQTLSALGDIIYNELVTTGISGDPGNVSILSNNGSITGQIINSAGQVAATGNGISFGSIFANSDTTLTSSTFIHGDQVSTPGAVALSAGGSLNVRQIEAGSLSISSAESFTLDRLVVNTRATIAATDVTIGVLQQNTAYPGPLYVSLTGKNGEVGHSASVFIDAPNGLVMPFLRERDTSISTTASLLEINSGTILGTLKLVTPWEAIWMNNRSSRPILGYEVQLFQPTGNFFLTQNVYATATNSFVTQYGPLAQIYDDLFGTYYLGASLVRDINRSNRIGDGVPLIPFYGYDSHDGRYLPTYDIEQYLEELHRLGVTKQGNGVPVNLSGSSAFNGRTDAVSAPFRLAARENRIWTAN